MKVLDTIQLTMTETYCGHWDLWCALRELVQNAHDVARERDIKIAEIEKAFEGISDEERNTEMWESHIRDFPQCVPSVSFSPRMQTDNIPQDGTVTIGASECCMPRSSLLLGKTTKRGNPHFVGEFGEGYKLALLVLTRMGHKVTVFNRDEVWVASFEPSQKFGGEKVLTITVYDRIDWLDSVSYGGIAESPPFNGVYFVVHGVGVKEWHEEIETKFLKHEADCVLLKSKDNAGKVFVGSLFAMTIGNLRFGYNFKPGQIDFGRDRRKPSYYDVQQLFAKFWFDAIVDDDEGAAEIVYDMLKNNANDVRSFASRLMWDDENKKVKEQILGCFSREHGEDAVPITRNSTIVNDTHIHCTFVLYEVLHHAKSFVSIDTKKTDVELIVEFADSHAAGFVMAARQDLDAIITTMETRAGKMRQF